MSTEISLNTDDKKIVYLIDGTACIYRSYYAIKGLRNSKGLSTNAIFGFTRMLMKLLDELSPKYMGVFFDAKGKNFRHIKYDNYKSSRSPMPADLVEQIPYIKQITNSLGITFFEMSEFEADDLIGTATRIIEEEGLSATIIAEDKDFIQLVSNNCKIWNPFKNVIIDKNYIIEKYGINPEQMIDVMGFSGDKADDIPGVPGVGIKTALKLVKKFSSMKSCYKRIDDVINKKQKENLLKFKEQAFLSRYLVEINTYSPISVKVNNFLVLVPNEDFLIHSFKKLEFKQLKERIDKKLLKNQGSCITITDKKMLENLMFNLSRSSKFAFSIKTDSADSMIAKFIGISVSAKIGESFYIPVSHNRFNVFDQLPISLVLEAFKPILVNPNIKKVGRDVQHDFIVLLRYGISMNGLEFDTELASYLIDPSRERYKSNRNIYNFPGYHNKNNISHYKQNSREKTSGSTCEDTDEILSDSNNLNPILAKYDLKNLMLNVELPLIEVLVRMKMNGISVDRNILRDLSLSLQRQLALLEDEIYIASGKKFNIKSPQQLSYLLFDYLGLPIHDKSKIKGGKYSTSAIVLKKLRPYHIIPSLVLKHREFSKLKSTYVDAILNLINNDTGRIHTSFNQTITSTGRLSSSNPNLQNIPVRTEFGKKVRKAFVPAKDCYFLSADYSQIELRVLAHYSKDPILVKSFKLCEDIHIRTASEIFGIPPENINESLRRQAKTINFGIIYGMGAYRLANELGTSYKIANKFINNYFERYKGVKEFIENIKNITYQTKITNTLMGRIRHLENIRSNNLNTRKIAERVAVNTVIQGTAADIIKVAMINLDKAISRANLKTKMLLSVHDEIILEVPKKELDSAKEMVLEAMESSSDLIVPLKIKMSYGESWAETNSST